MLAVIFLVALAVIPVSLGQQTCDASTRCGSAAPCCSEYGYCGTGPGFCIGGCNPQYSYAWDSCKPTPICQNATYTFHDDSRIVNSTLYDGNATKYDFTLDKGDLYNLNDSAGDLALLLTETNGGTRMSSTRYMWYGTVEAKLKATKWAGVVTAFITMSDVRDEIDWEWPGANTSSAQSNFFWLGEVHYPSTNGQVEPVSDTYSTFHTYKMDWQENQLTWSIDGATVRTVNKSNTVVNGTAQYPTTPARVQLSVWPAGINTSAPGTIQWSGGMINWSDPDYTAAGGHFAAVFESVSVTCATPLNPSNARSYVYSGLNAQGVPIAYVSNATTVINAARSRVQFSRTRLWSASAAAVGVAMGMAIFA